MRHASAHETLSVSRVRTHTHRVHTTHTERLVCKLEELVLKSVLELPRLAVAAATREAAAAAATASTAGPAAAAPAISAAATTSAGVPSLHSGNNNDASLGTAGANYSLSHAAGAAAASSSTSSSSSSSSSQSLTYVAEFLDLLLVVFRNDLACLSGSPAAAAVVASRRRREPFLFYRGRLRVCARLAAFYSYVPSFSVLHDVCATILQSLCTLFFVVAPPTSKERIS